MVSICINWFCYYITSIIILCTPTPTGLACYETANFNTTTCAWVVSGSQPVSEQEIEFESKIEVNNPKHTFAGY